MADDSRPSLLGPLFRVGSGVFVGLVFIVCLIGIIVSGPIVVTPSPLDTGATTSEGRLRRDVETLSVRIGPRNAAHPARLLDAAQWIREQFEAAGLEVRVQDYEVEGATYRNVVALQPGTDDSAGALVIGAHYDAFGEFAGADDNASGVAVMLELARTLPQSCGRGTRYFVAFSTEEPPHFGSEQMGSYVFAASLVEGDVDVELMIALDMVGYFDSSPDSQSFPIKGMGWLYPDRGNFIAVVGDLGVARSVKRVKQGIRATEAIPVYSFRAPPSLAPVHLSDHWSFRQFDLPAVQLTDTSFMRNPNYHSASDTPETLDYGMMERVVQGLHGVLWDADAPGRCFERTPADNPIPEQIQPNTTSQVNDTTPNK